MSQLARIRERTRTISNLRKVTRAMELVTKTKINKIRQNAGNAKSFHEAYQDMFDTVLQAYQEETHGAAGDAPARKNYILGFLSQKGFCGNFNDKILSKIHGIFHAVQEEKALYLLGKRTSKWTYAVKHPFTHFEGLEKTFLSDCFPLIETWTEEITQNKPIRIYFAYNEFVSILDQRPTMLQIYPFETTRRETAAGRPIFEPEPEILMASLIEGYLCACIEKVYWESLAGEYCSRLISMKNANENATMIIDSLQLLYNKTRQAKITQELSEIVSAFDVLKTMQEKKMKEEE